MTGYDCLVSPGLIYTPCEGCEGRGEWRVQRETKNIKQMKNFLRAAAGPGTCLFNMAFNCDFKNAIGKQ